MIYTVTLNPTLDVTYVLERLEPGETAMALDVERTPGGKGINVSRALNAMGMDSVAMGLIGGFSGFELISLLQDEGLILQMVKIDGDTRTNVVILGREDGRELVIRAAGPPVESAPVEKLRHLLFADAHRPEMVVLSGSVPPGVDEGVYAAFIEEGRSLGSLMVLDTAGGCLRAGVEAAPYMVKPNLGELEALAGRRLRGDREVLEFARELCAAGVEVVVVSLGRDGAVLVSAGEAWRGRVPHVEEDTVGAGDSMVAGIVMGMKLGEDLETMFSRGLAFGLAAVMNCGPGLTRPDIYERARGLVRVERWSGGG